MSYITWLRSKVGHRKVILAYSSIVLRDNMGRILLQRRADFNVWGLPGGILEPGESILDCAHRELLEETGLTANELKLVGVYSDPKYDTVYPNGDLVQQYNVCFQGTLKAGRRQSDSAETSALDFFDPRDIPFVEMPNFYIAMLCDALDGRKPAFLPPYTKPKVVNPVEIIRPLIGRSLFIAVGAHIVILHADGSLLMVRRSDDGYWSLPGGHTHLGENVAHTAVREAFEETGVHVALDRIIGVMSPVTPWVYPNGDQTQTLVTIFLARPLSNAPKPDRVETSQVSWMTPDQVVALKTHPTLAQLNQAVVEHLEGGVFIL